MNFEPEYACDEDETVDWSDCDYGSPGEDEARADYEAEREGPHAELWSVIEAGERNRSLRRDRRVSCAVAKLRDATEPLYHSGNGYCYEDVDGFTGDWDELYPIAARRMQFVKWLIGRAIAAVCQVFREIARHLAELAAAVSVKFHRRTPTIAAPPAELVRSHPDAARAPNVQRVALSCDVLATAA